MMRTPTIRASKTGAILGNSKWESKQAAIEDIIIWCVFEKPPLSIINEVDDSAMAHGRVNESVAIESLELLLKSDIHDTLDNEKNEQKNYKADMEGIPVSATPDGWCEINGEVWLVEVKCPTREENIHLKNNPQYLDQMQMQLYCFNKTRERDGKPQAVGVKFYSWFEGAETSPVDVKYDKDYFTPDKIEELRDAWDFIHIVMNDEAESKKMLNGILKVPDKIIKNPPEIKKLLRLKKDIKDAEEQVKKLEERLVDDHTEDGTKNVIFINEKGEMTHIAETTVSRKTDWRQYKADMAVPIVRYQDIEVGRKLHASRSKDLHNYLEAFKLVVGEDGQPDVDERTPEEREEARKERARLKRAQKKEEKENAEKNN